MAATDQTYRHQKTLDIVFGASCVLMLLSVIWMFAQDYNRSYKVEARDFRDVEEAMYEREMLAKLPDDDTMKQIAAAEKELAEARKERDRKAKELEGEIKE